MISKIKKPVSIILTVLMVVSLFTIVPFTASAAENVALLDGTTEYATVQAAMAAITDNDPHTIKLLASVEETLTISNKTLTIDLNGFNITSALSSKMAVNANNGAKLTINNSNTAKSENTPTQNAILGGTGTNNRGSLSASGAGTTVDIRAGYYYGYNGNKTAIHAINGATITFYDCVVNGAQGIDDSTTGKEGKVFYSGVNNPAKPNDETPGYIVVHGGVFNGRMSDSNWGNYLIDGGTFDRNSVVLNENPVDANGKRVATASGNMTKIKDGTFYDSDWLADGFAPVANSDGTFTVDGPYVARIGNTPYATLAAAIAAAQAGDTVKLIANVTEAVSITGKTLTLDLNGFNITSPSSTQPIKAYGGTKLTIVNTNDNKAENTPTQNAVLGSTGGANNYGSLFASGEGTEVIINAGYYYGYNGDKTAIHAVNKAKVTFNDCVVNGAAGFDGTGTTGKEGKIFYSGVGNPTQPYAMDPGYIVVHGGTFSGRMSDSNWGNYLIDGGTFDRNVVVINENPVDANGNRVATASGNMTKIKDGTLEEAGWLAPGYKVVDNGDGTYGVTKKLFVGHNLLLGGDIGVNFYLNPVILDSYNGTKTVKFTCDGEETTVAVPATADAKGYKVTLNVVAARMAHKINAVVYVNNGSTALAETDSYSVQDYAEAVFAEPAKYTTNAKAPALKALAKAMLNYGAQAQNVFASSLKDKTPAPANTTVGNNGYSAVTVGDVQNAINGDASDLTAIAAQLNAEYYTSSLIYLQNNTLRIYFTPKSKQLGGLDGMGFDGNLSDYYYYEDVTDIAAAELDNQQTFTVNGVEFQYSALDYVVAVLNSNKMGPAQQNLAKSLFLYNQAANAYFD